MAINRSRIIILIATISALAISASAIEHTVGGDEGWTSGIDYNEWVFKQEYHVGDKLIFNYPIGQYNVFQVADAEAFDACALPPQEKALSSGSDVVNLDTPGHKYFICGTKDYVTGKLYCNDIPPMKFYIHVLPPLAGGGDPLPASTGKDYIVGDDKGWYCNVDYKAWANGKKFQIGDRLIFMYQKGKHNVFQAIDETSFKECNPPAQEPATSGYDVITLKSPDTWFMCGVGDHCKKGMKLFVHACDSGSKSPSVQGARKLVSTKL